MPSNFPPWQTFYHVFRQWTLDHTWTAVEEALRTCVRLRERREAEPYAAVLDSQSVKSDGHGGEVGYDAAKCIKGRKRHILVNMLGLLLGVAVTPANCLEREGGNAVLEKIAGWLGRLRKIWVNDGYSGESFDKWVRQFHPNAHIGFIPDPGYSFYFSIVEFQLNLKAVMLRKIKFHIRKASHKLIDFRHSSWLNFDNYYETPFFISGMHN